MSKWPVQKQTHRTAQKHAEHQDAADIQQKCVFRLFLFYFLFMNSFMISPRNVELPPCYGH